MATTYPTTQLQPGATGDSVKQLQDFLVSQGYLTQAQVNTGYGTYGPQTTAAVLNLQKSLGIDYSSGPGYYGPLTVAAVTKKYTPAPAPVVTPTPAPVVPPVVAKTPNQIAQEQQNPQNQNQNQNTQTSPVVTPPSLVTPPANSETLATQGLAYKIKYGDSLSQIAVNNGTTVSALMAANPKIKNANLIYAGDTIVIPKGDVPTKTGATVAPTDTTTPKTTTPATAVTPQQQESEINNSIIASMIAETKKIQDDLGSNVDVANSADLVKKLIGTLETNAETPPVSLEKKFADTKTALGVDALETDLAQKDAAIKNLDTEYQSNLTEQEQQLQSMREINRNKSEKQISYERERALLVADRDSALTQLNMKNNTVQSIMTYAGQDYNNAQQNYSTKFSQILQLTNLLSGIEDRAQTQQEKLQNTAKANLTILSDMIKNGNLNYSSLDTVTKSNISTMELQAGLPQGYLSHLTKTIDAPITSFLPAYDDVNGNRVQPVGTINKSTGAFQIVNTIIGKAKDTTSGSNLTEAEFGRKAVSDMEAQLSSVIGPKDGHVSPDDWAKARTAWIKTFPNNQNASSQFDTIFAQYIDPTHAQDYATDPGQGFK